MSRTTHDQKGLTLLGNTARHEVRGYDCTLLEAFANQHVENDYWVTLTCPEFTSLCPRTGQPDFATLTVQYIPDHRMVESKSLKLYLHGFRNHGDFHEDCVNRILKDLVELMEPRYLEVLGRFHPRGGISIDPYCNYGRPGTRYEALAEDRLWRYNGTREPRRSLHDGI